MNKINRLQLRSAKLEQHQYDLDNLLKDLEKKEYIDYYNDIKNIKTYESQARILDELPISIKHKFENFIEKGSENGFLLVKGIFLEDQATIPKTPKTNKEKIGEQTLFARVQAIFLQFIGEMIAYEAEGYGRLFQDVVPMKTMAYKQTSVGSEKELEIHTEQAFSKLRPDILSLACLRGDSAAYTYVLPVHYLLEKLTETEIQLLRQPLWFTGVDLSFQLNGQPFLEGELRGPLSILSGCKEDTKFVFDQDLFKGITEESREMIQKIISIYYQYRNEHNLAKGEIIFIDNRRAVHGRSSFVPRYDGYDRFLIRSFAVFDYESSCYARPNNGRMVSAKYS
jgi:L-asparagine oxygenase